MTHFTVYNFNTGLITNKGECEPIDVYMQAKDGEFVHLGEKVDGDLWYFPDGVKTPRPDLGIVSEYTIDADGVAAVEIALPAGSVVEDLTTGETWPDETEFYFSSQAIGSSRYRITPTFPAQGPIKVTIHAS